MILYPGVRVLIVLRWLFNLNIFTPGPLQISSNDISSICKSPPNLDEFFLHLNHPSLAMNLRVLG